MILQSRSFSTFPSPTYSLSFSILRSLVPRGCTTVLSGGLGQWGHWQEVRWQEEGEVRVFVPDHWPGYSFRSSYDPVWASAFFQLVSL